MSTMVGVPYLTPKNNFVDNKPSSLTYFAIHAIAKTVSYTATIAKTVSYTASKPDRHGHKGVETRPLWLTPEFLRAARVFIKEMSSGQYTNQGHRYMPTSAFVYVPSEIQGIKQEGRKR